MPETPVVATEEAKVDARDRPRTDRRDRRGMNKDRKKEMAR